MADTIEEVVNVRLTGAYSPFHNRDQEEPRLPFCHMGSRDDFICQCPNGDAMTFDCTVLGTNLGTVIRNEQKSRSSMSGALALCKRGTLHSSCQLVGVHRTSIGQRTAIAS